MTRKRHYKFWSAKEDLLLINKKIKNEEPKKILRDLKKLTDIERSLIGIYCRTNYLKSFYKTKNFNEILQKIKQNKIIENSNAEKSQENGLKKIFNDFYEKQLSPYLKERENAYANKEPENYNSFNKYLNEKYLILEINKLNKKLNDKEKSQLEKILEKLNSKETKDIEKAKKSKNYQYPLLDLTPSKIREKILEMKKQNATNEQISEAYPKRMKQNIGAYLSHFTRGHYHKRKLI